MADTDHEILSEGFIEGFERRYPTHVLETLLCDRTTGKNIIWADNEYEALGDGYLGDDEITVEKICGLASGVIKPRIAKGAERQSQRTKSRAEVFTPSWLCNQMNNDIDAVWFGRRDAFNTETVGDDGARGWTAVPEPVAFPKAKGHGWHAYVEATRLEITCGEAPFVCSRYDTVTGEPLPVHERIGFLDRKLRAVSENAKTRPTWTKWALTALRSCYGYEYQGDNLLIARINVFETYMEHLRARWSAPATAEDLEQAALVVSWNFWQMNGFTDAVPTNKMDAVAESPLGEQSALFEEPQLEQMQMSMFDLLGEPEPDPVEEPMQESVPLCVLYDWKNGEPFEFAALKGKANLMGKKFYAVIGNPPYQLSIKDDETDNKTYAPPIYHEFMDAAFGVAEKTELITPARFLFNAGSTPKAWNRKMLNDPHFKVMNYEADASKIFANTDIKGGVAVTYRDASQNYGAIEVFTHFDELRTIKAKVQDANELSLSEIIYAADSYHFTEAMHEDHSEIRYVDKDHGLLSKGHDYDLKTNVIDNLDGVVLYDQCPDDKDKYIQIFGRGKAGRAYKFISERYISPHPNLNTWKVFVPAANGSGALGEVLSTPMIGQPMIGQPMIGHTQSFISIGSFDTEAEAEALLKYVKTKFARTMLGILKITQHNPAPKWKYVPLQDFTPASDIDWSKPIPEIDRQLYAKYGLDEGEIEFIESHVKEMA